MGKIQDDAAGPPVTVGGRAPHERAALTGRRRVDRIATGSSRGTHDSERVAS
jgi:hypothetical protein